jgi:hypothetical protein
VRTNAAEAEILKMPHFREMPYLMINEYYMPNQNLASGRNKSLNNPNLPIPKPRDFYFVLQKSITTPSEAFFKSALAYTKTAILDGCKSRGKIERRSLI